MPSFKNDYGVMAHRRVIEALLKCENEVNIPYGNDIHSANAEKIIKDIFKAPEAKVHFLSGGTQANATVISYILRPYEAVISCDSGHINVHETGAVEGTGIKIITVNNVNGKLTKENVIKALKLHTDEHMVKPKMLYISNSTECGSIYTKQELYDLRAVCDEYNLYLFLDGARLASALTSEANDVEYEDLAKTCDVFYVGGTKNGLLSGEAVVIVNKSLQENFRYHIKNKGAMLAKGFVLGIQFEEIFKDGLYFKLADYANKMARYIKDNLQKLDVSFTIDSPTNQLFAKFNKQIASILIEKFGCELWENHDDYSVIRFVTSFKTTKEDCDELIYEISNLLEKEI